MGVWVDVWMDVWVGEWGEDATRNTHPQQVLVEDDVERGGHTVVYDFVLVVCPYR